MRDKKILIIEDDSVSANALKTKLENCNFTTRVARDGVEGLRYAQNEKYDLIILDLLLPKMYGIEILKKIRSKEKTKNIPVIILTNVDKPSEKKIGEKLGVDVYFIKTDTHIDSVVQKINKLTR